MSDAESERMKANHAERMRDDHVPGKASKPLPPVEQNTGVRKKVGPAQRETVPDHSEPPPAPAPTLDPPPTPDPTPKVRVEFVAGGGNGGMNGMRHGHVDVEPDKTYEVVVGKAGEPTSFSGPIDAPGLTELSKLVAEAGGKLSADNVRGLITQECRALEAMLLDKNAKYGNSALNPKRIFSKASPIEQLFVRIDDKLSRIENTGIASADEDTLADLQGYITLLRVARRLGLT